MTKRSSGPLTAHPGNPSMGSPLSMTAGTTPLARSRSSARSNRVGVSNGFVFIGACEALGECHAQTNRDQRSALRALQSRQRAHLVERSTLDRYLWAKAREGA